jgi:hypothetical protein
MNELIVVVASVLLSLLLTWTSDKLGLSAYMARAARWAAQEAILEDIRQGMPEERSPKGVER